MKTNKLQALKKGDLAVCIPGFEGEESHNPRVTNENYGGHAYVSGMMFITKETNSFRENNFVHWTNGGGGIFAKALRPANPEEKEAFSFKITNILNLKKLFKISYTSINGTLNKAELEAHTEEEAINSIKDLKTINYVIS